MTLFVDSWYYRFVQKERGERVNEVKLKSLQERRTVVVKSLEHAVSNGDRGLAEVCEAELKLLSKEIKRIREKQEVFTGGSTQAPFDD